MLIKDNNTELYHSATYLGKDYSDGIKHWKYIKREKVNGRWRYYYDNSSLKKAEKRYNKSLNDAARKSVNDLATASEYKSEINENRDHASRARTVREADQLDIRYSNYLKPQYDYYSKGGNQTENERIDAAIKRASKKLRQERIMSATIGSLAKGVINGLNAISSGKQKVGKLFKKLFK